jgi:3-phenylpropionate/trans-cinnamate dioxygenase ferredoxin reductase component
MTAAGLEADTNALQTILIVGAGQAGGRAAEAIRARGFAGRLLLVGDEAYLPYERPSLSKDVMLAGDDANCFSGWLQKEAFYSDQRIEWISDSIELIDCTNRTAALRHGSAIGFDLCLLATGGRARMLPGISEGRHVYSLRTLAHAMRLRERLTRSRTVAVVGGGFLGLEFAASAKARGLDVTVYESAPRLLSRAMPADFAQRLQAKHEAQGVRFVLEAGALQLNESQYGVTVVASSGAADFDFCVCAVGQVPNDELARISGIETGNGILVDALCRTSAPGIYAAGDCTNFPFGPRSRGVRLESWQNAQEQALVAARNMLGEAIEYRPTPWFWTDQYDWNVQMLGMPDSTIDHWVERSSDVDKTMLMGLRDGVIVYALAVNQGGELRAIRKLIEDVVPVDLAELADPSIKFRQLGRKSN